MTTALWGSTALLFRERWLWFLAGSLTVLMPLSRMYLARHFLAGVLGGVALGMVVIGVTWRFAVVPVAGRQRGSTRLPDGWRPEVKRLLLFLAPPLLAALLPGVGLETVTRLVGVNLGLWLLTRGGLPRDGGEPKARFLRVVLAVALYALTNRVLGAGLEMSLGESDMGEAVVEGASTFVLTWGTTVLSYRLGLYERGQPGEGLLRLEG